MICPSCRQDVAPIVRGVRTYCTSCGAALPFTAAPEAVNVAGQPAKVGSGIVRVLGTLVLVGGALIAMFFGFLAWLFSAAVPLYFAGFFTVVALIAALPLFFAGKKLSEAGDDSKRAAQERAVFTLAARQRGVLTVATVARALSIGEPEADELLTALAKKPDGRVSLEVDDNGGLSYVFRDLVPATNPASRVRVSADGWRAPAPPPEAKPRVVDAELVDEEAAAEAEAEAHRLAR
jgi:hypothetical protein